MRVAGEAVDALATAPTVVGCEAMFVAARRPPGTLPAMHRILIASILGLFACGSSATRAPSAAAPGATTASGDDDIICADEVSPTTGMPHRVCHRQVASSAETGESDVQCNDEVPTGTQMTKRICRSSSEKAQDKRAVQDLYLDPTSRVGQ